MAPPQEGYDISHHKINYVYIKIPDDERPIVKTNMYIYKCAYVIILRGPASKGVIFCH